MDYHTLNGTELNVSILGLGCNNFGPPRIDEQATHRVIHAAQDLEINFLDTAIGYGDGESEKYIGTAMADGRRDKWMIATKFSLGRNEGNESVEQRIRSQVEQSLSKLQTEYIDLYQLHQPSRNLDDEEEILRTLNALVDEGKVRYYGNSNYPSWRLAESNMLAKEIGARPWVTAQNHYSLLRRQIEAELVPYCTARKVDIIPYFPLAGGFLTGKYEKGKEAPAGSRGATGSGVIRNMSNERNYELVPKLQQWAEARGHTVTELAYAWLFANPAVGCVISGVSNPEQVQSNITAVNWKLTPEEKKEVDEIAPREGDDEGQSVGPRANAAPPAGR